jgi:hypothetical protein
MPLVIAQARALSEYDDWAAAHPKATRSEAMDAAQDVAGRFAVVNWDQVKITLGRSRYFDQARALQEYKVEDVERALDQLAADDEAGRLSDAQLTTEFRRLQDWRNILAREQRPREQRGRQR